MLKFAKNVLLIGLLTAAASPAFARSWTDDLSAAGPETLIRAEHGQELKSAIDEARTQCSLVPQDWTQPPYAAAAAIETGKMITGEQLYGLRMAITKVFYDRGIASAGVPSESGNTNSVWFTSDAEPGARVLGTQIQDMRLAMDYLETAGCGTPPSSCAPTECDAGQLGMTTGGNCGGCNPSGSTVSTIGPGCRSYQCQNGVWVDVGAPALCEWAASCT